MPYYCDKNKNMSVLVSLVQLVWTIYNICKVRGSNLVHHTKKICLMIYLFGTMTYTYWSLNDLLVIFIKRDVLVAINNDVIFAFILFFKI